MKTIELVPLKKSTTATISIPGSKSYTNRALLLSSLVKNTVVIKNPLLSDDTHAMVGCLQELGIEIKVFENEIHVIGSVFDVKNKTHNLNAHLSGTTLRFLLPLLCIIPGVKNITGEESLNRRPIKDLVTSLKNLGATIEYLEKDGFPPLRITSSHLKPKNISISGEMSSQYISALLMIAPLIGSFEIDVEKEQVSKPYIEMTLSIMKDFGVKIKNENFKKYTITKSNYKESEYVVEGDFSSAGYFLAIAPLTKSKISLLNLNKNSLQADKKLISVLEQMGNKVFFEKNKITIHGKGVKAMHVDVVDFPDQAQTLAVLLSFAKGISILTGIKTLRVKETERVQALEKELLKMGIKTSSDENSLTIFGGDPKAATIDTYNDHRMAMSFAVAGSVLSDLKINNPEVVTKTFPDFWEKLESIGITVLSHDKNIVLIGMRGSGKSAIAKILSEKLKREILELDALLIKKVGMKIPDLIEKKGWDYFRDVESEIAQEVSGLKNKIISTGGGVITREKNIEELSKNGMFVYLKASVDTLLSRIGEDPNRPALTDKKNKRDEMQELLFQRSSLYEKTADIIIETDEMNVEEVGQRVVKSLIRSTSSGRELKIKS